MHFHKMKFEKRITIYFTILMICIIILLNIITLIAMRVQFFFIQSKTLNTTIKQLENFFENTPPMSIKANPDFLLQVEQLRNNNIFIRITVNNNPSFDNTKSISHITKFGLEHLRFKRFFFSKEKSFLFNGEKIKIVLIRDIRQELTIFRTVMFLMGLVSIFGIILIYFFSKVISKSLLRPVNDIISTAKNISVNDMTKRVPVSPANDELTQLGIVLNAMLDRLQESFEIQNRFVEDASHELRTPLQIMRGYAELLDSWGKNDPIIAAESIASIKEEVYNMISLVERLLFLAKRDNNSLLLQLEEIQMNEFMDKFIKDMSIVSNGRKIVFTANESYVINGDLKLIMQSLRAIVDNSIKYSNENSIIEISSRLCENKAVIEVTDQGVGIDENDLNQIFTRFYRADTSRTKDTGGAGLGLSIVKAIITLHKGSVAIKSQLGKGTTVIIELPCF